MKYFYSSLFLTLLSASTVFGQDDVIDSISDILNRTTNKVEIANLHAELAKAYKYNNIDTARYFAERGYQLSIEVDYNEGLVENAATLADIYVIDNKLKDAKEYYSIALEGLSNEENTFDFVQISMIIGNIDLAQNNYIQALQVYQSCLDLAIENHLDHLSPHLYNNLGVLYLAMEEFDDANDYFVKARRLFEDLGEDYNAAQSLLNISMIQGKLGNYEKAISGYLDAIRMFSEQESWEDIASANNSISELYFFNKDYEKAEKYLDIALNVIVNNSSTFDGPLSMFQTDIYSNAANIFFYKEDFKISMDYAYKAYDLSRANSYKEKIFENAKTLSFIYEKQNQVDSALSYYKTYIKFNEEYQQENDIKRITKLKMQHEFDTILFNKEVESIKKEAEQKQREIWYLVTITFAILSTIIIVLLYLNQKSKTTKTLLKKENLELEKIKLNQDLNYKKKELATNMMYLLEKNEFIASIGKKLIEIKPTAKKTNQDIIQQIINELKHNSSVKMWDEFEIRFKEVHSEFYNALHKRFPDLTPNEIKICAFLRLNMSSKEISAITHQSVKSITVARTRLRKKINLERDENLISFLSKL